LAVAGLGDLAQRAGVPDGQLSLRDLPRSHTLLFLADPRAPTVRCLQDNPASTRLLREQLHSRVPVFEETVDQIVGVLYTKDLLPYLRGLPADFDLRARLHPPYFVPESKRADALLREFQAKKLHLAIVVDEYGGTAGLVTLEDLLEELVGEIRTFVRMFFDIRYRMSWFTWLVTVVGLSFALLSHWVVPFAFVPFVGPVLDKVVDLILAFFVYKALSREARRYRQLREGRIP